MTATATLAPGGVVWAKATRITALDNEGNIIPGSSVFVTDQLMKATITPVNEAGDTSAIKNASGNLGVYPSRETSRSGTPLPWRWSSPTRS